MIEDYMDYYNNRSVQRNLVGADTHGNIYSEDSCITKQEHPLGCSCKNNFLYCFTVCLMGSSPEKTHCCAI